MPLRFDTLFEEAGIAPADVHLLRHQPVVGGRALADVWRADRALFEAYQSKQEARRCERNSAIAGISAKSR